MREAQARPVVNIVGERVALSPLRRDLLETYQRWFNEFQTLCTPCDMPRPVTLEEQTAQYEAIASGSATRVGFQIYERATWEPIGTCALIDIDHRNGTAEFVIIIGEPTHRGRGFGTEATRLALDYAFTALGLHNVMLKVYEFNRAGIRAYQKAGFKEIGRRRGARRFAGRRWDVIYMDCVADEFTSPVLSEIFRPDSPRPDSQ
ncbi:GNAT family N-acetyltransferase [Sphaerobacter thermophilus]|uniref:GCN5-related N-acetyltransferase n=1 Tax=Sphaerobacter thermophilus (strain ATCC 49802 / DSM 20745 / KCCM 41009 / NCIMB 13125 / S 6022) TaxID=479434 RepID=D1C873_SPHTD|nr:GNAT family N-acetyltransferase [Sphaerobacter thermophilus]ACZ40016.1 GCN5-related N-acetyltransferase [Sphaerobacter thermophilus DSM 20745]PZN62095.1 MAG: N-acetyltransferase [Sphaerobacter thermophilus]